VAGEASVLMLHEAKRTGRVTKMATMRRKKAHMKRGKILVHSWDEALDIINGKKIVHRGIEGVIHIDRSRKHDTRFMVIPTAKGRKTKTYLDDKRYLHDDWDFDLTHSDMAADIASKFVDFERK
jgi:hypothetical protein